MAGYAQNYAQEFATEPYSDYGGAPFYSKKIRREPNTVMFFTAVVVPWLFFVIPLSVTVLASYSSPSGVLLFDLVIVLAVLFVGNSALKAYRDPWSSQDPGWLAYLFLICFVAASAGMYLGRVNYVVNARPYWDVHSLNFYHSVDPSTYRGNQLMDSGKIEFTQDAYIDTTRTMGFTNNDIYCVAPITSPSRTDNTYDFWAVGINCCPGATTQDFRCGEYSNTEAHSGLRLMREADRAYYRLAVQQAEVSYHIQANHPLFFVWLKEPDTELEAYLTDAFRYTMAGVVVSLVATFLGAVGAAVALR
uniref:Uncharacterized protein n=1 Tax=Noctiluca scintillans TaxID=2966 RepID=A0A7S1F1X9_NOCSC|mmetsp:Transcript_27746/g.73268  ORF Transcript_27746/g.73268 Transcript_27746/m.73268 type:complete len:305 (+) Transcript_27746:93-1007(+)|eukprot:CAMPEP_0194481806 /NCGR_PEP_ID=MMETSP0253-20130528/4054_1 /TAXON_ID=2966 /ORGANISM="Noctiluca scintillans" /LENGTH=304 /DNA_ID=CAMNT_0039321311 /DNA_START=87 /DNA_END=1001 /DNA_ORIENTATION=+